MKPRYNIYMLLVLTAYVALVFAAMTQPDSYWRDVLAYVTITAIVLFLRRE